MTLQAQPGIQRLTSPAFPPWAVLLCGVLAVSTAAIFIRYAQADASSLTIAAYRLGLASLFLAPVALRGWGEIRQIEGRRLILMLAAGLALAVHFASWITSLELTTVASSVVLVTTTPLWVALFSPIFLGERMPASVWLGLALAMTGGMVVGLNESCSWQGGLHCRELDQMFEGQAVWGNVLALVGAWCAAAYMMLGRRLRGNLSLTSYTFIVYGTAAVALLLACILTRQPMADFPPITYVWFLALAVIPQLLGHSAFNWALRYVPAAKVSVVLLGEPIGSAILAFFLLNETPGLLELIGGGIILAGIYLVSQRS